MEPKLFLVVVLVGLAVLAVVAGISILPERRLRGVGSYLRKAIDDPEEAAQIPRELQPISAELAALRSRLASQEEEVRRSEQRRQDLTAFLAHDLKTPLTSVLGYLELLRDEPGLTEEQRAKYTGIALDKAKRLEALVGEFFDINTMDLELKTTDPVQISFLLEQLADEFYPLFAAKELTCAPQIQPGLVVRGDGDKLARVFDNILRNAVSYSTPGGEVGLTARSVDSTLQVTVSNEGLEIPESELSNIFEKFYRLDAARSTHTGGAGLGLAIAKEIVELHGGAIRAECTGNRTSFVITLPLEPPSPSEHRGHRTHKEKSKNPQ